MARSNRETFDNTYKGTQEQPLLPPLRDDGKQPGTPAPNLQKFRETEDKITREKRLREIWKSLPVISTNQPEHGKKPISITKDASERAEKIKQLYNQELMSRSEGGGAKPVDFKQFVKVCVDIVFDAGA